MPKKPSQILEEYGVDVITTYQATIFFEYPDDDDEVGVVVANRFLQKGIDPDRVSIDLMEPSPASSPYFEITGYSRTLVTREAAWVLTQLIDLGATVPK